MAERGGGRVREIASTWPPRGAAQAGGLAPAGFDAFTSQVAKLKSWARAEAGAGRLFPWVPVAFGAGIAVYFAADREPVLFAAVAADSTRTGKYLCHRNLPDGMDCACRPHATALFGVAVRFR